MVGSVLTVKVVEGRELQSSRLAGSPNPYVVLSIEGQKSKTEENTGTTEPVWNDVNSFDIVTGREDLEIFVYDRSDIGNDGVIGGCAISLDNLKDQHKHEEWVNIYNGENYVGKLKVQLHWIHSRKLFLQDILKIQDMSIEDEKAEKQELEETLKKMKQPFGFIQAYYI